MTHPKATTPRTCEQCGAEFMAPISEARKVGRARFCGRICANKARAVTLVDRACKVCGAAFQLHPSEAKKGYGTCCSVECATIAKTIPIAHRLATEVDKSGECWLWTGLLNRRGYGVTRHNGRACLAHRKAWELANGPIPDGFMVCHRCDVRNCIRPDHLFLGSAADNTADMIAKGRPHGRPPKSATARHTTPPKSYEQDARQHGPQ